MLLGQLAAELLAEFVHVLAEDAGVLLGEVDVLEDAVGRGDTLPPHEEPAVQPLLVQPHDLARLDLAEELGADRIDRATFAGHDVAPAGRLTDAQRPNPIGIAGRLDVIGEQEDERVGALEMVENVPQRVGLVLMGRLGQQMNDDLGVATGLEDAAVGLVFVPQQAGIDQIAVVGDRDLPPGILRQQGLTVLHRGRTRRRVPDVPDGDGVSQLLERVRAAAKDPHDRAHALVALDALAVAGGDPGRLLASMLQGVQTEVGLLHRIGVAEDPEQPTFFLLLRKDLVPDAI